MGKIMAKIIPQSELEEILNILSLASEGLQLSEFLSSLGHLQRYTLAKAISFSC
jgi:hypothetical protein